MDQLSKTHLTACGKFSDLFRKTGQFLPPVTALTGVWQAIFCANANFFVYHNEIFLKTFTIVIRDPNLS